MPYEEEGDGIISAAGLPAKLGFLAGGLKGRIVSKSGEDERVDEASMEFLAQKKKVSIGFTDDSAIITFSDGREIRIHKDDCPAETATKVLKFLGYEIE